MGINRNIYIYILFHQKNNQAIIIISLYDMQKKSRSIDWH